MATSKERIKGAFDHKTQDCVPVDFGSTAVTGMHVICVETLRDYYGLEKHPIKTGEPYQMLGVIEEDLLDALGIDTVPLPAPTTMFGFRNENWKEFKAPWGQILLVPERFNTTKDDNGDLLIYPQGDTSAPPSGRMPADGFFFDSIIRQEPIDDDNLNPEDNLEEFEEISEADLNYYAVSAKQLSSSKRAVVAGIGGTAFGDIALVPAPFLKHPKGIRDVTEWYISTAARQDYIHAIFSAQCDIAIKNIEKVHSVIGNAVDVMFICGTDFGTQTSSFCSTDTYEELYAPYYKRINGWIHKNTAWKTFKHSCGAVEKFIPHFIDSGFDILNPVQCSATGMDPQTLKDRYGDSIVFWGGGVDTQKTMPFGKPEQVREEVLKRCEIFSRNGGFVFNTVHNILANTPPVNIVAMIDAVKEFNGLQ
ncbi:MAG: methyltransferase [Lentisphaerae bacterium]|nr:methyltransferase [Lentisphaerota bacterium]